MRPGCVLCEGAASEMADEVDPQRSGNTPAGEGRLKRDNRPPGLTGDQLS